MEFVQDKYDVWKYPMSTWGAAISHFVIASPPTFLGCFYFSPILSISFYIFGYPQTALFLLFLFVKAQALLFQDGIKWLDLYNVEFIAASSVGGLRPNSGASTTSMMRRPPWRAMIWKMMMVVPLLNIFVTFIHRQDLLLDYYPLKMYNFQFSHQCGFLDLIRSWRLMIWKVMMVEPLP